MFCVCWERLVLVGWDEPLRPLAYIMLDAVTLDMKGWKVVDTPLHIQGDDISIYSLIMVSCLFFPSVPWLTSLHSVTCGSGCTSYILIRHELCIYHPPISHHTVHNPYIWPVWCIIYFNSPWAVNNIYPVLTTRCTPHTFSQFGARFKTTLNQY